MIRFLVVLMKSLNLLRRKSIKIGVTQLEKRCKVRGWSFDERKSMNPPKCRAEDYIQWLIASPKVASCTQAATSTPGFVAHDAYTRLLQRLEQESETLWQMKSKTLCHSAPAGLCSMIQPLINSRRTRWSWWPVTGWENIMLSGHTHRTITNSAA